MSYWRWAGLQSASHPAEQWVAGLGALCAIALTWAATAALTDSHGAVAILPSMGAAAVLLFAAPEAPLSQPWALVVANVVAAFIGVTIGLLVSDALIAAALAVSLSILCMHSLRCVHPPAGATALAAIIGGDSISALGYAYVLIPTLSNCLVLLVVALLFNNVFPWRRYPSAWQPYELLEPGVSKSGQKAEVSAEALAQAATSLQWQVSAEQWQALAEVLNSPEGAITASSADIEVGGLYSNGVPGGQWSVREVLELRPHEDQRRYTVVYRCVSGAQKGREDSASLLDFNAWSKQRLRRR